MRARGPRHPARGRPMAWGTPMGTQVRLCLQHPHCGLHKLVNGPLQYGVPAPVAFGSHLAAPVLLLICCALTLTALPAQSMYSKQPPAVYCLHAVLCDSQTGCCCAASRALPTGCITAGQRADRVSGAILLLLEFSIDALAIQERIAEAAPRGEPLPSGPVQPLSEKCVHPCSQPRCHCSVVFLVLAAALASGLSATRVRCCGVRKASGVCLCVCTCSCMTGGWQQATDRPGVPQADRGDGGGAAGGSRHAAAVPGGQGPSA